MKNLTDIMAMNGPELSRFVGRLMHQPVIDGLLHTRRREFIDAVDAVMDNEQLPEWVARIIVDATTPATRTLSVCRSTNESQQKSGFYLPLTGNHLPVEKFNPYHDKLGRFAPKEGGGLSPEQERKQKVESFAEMRK